MGNNQEASITFKKCLVLLEGLKEKFGEEKYSDQKKYLKKKIRAADE